MDPSTPPPPTPQPVFRPTSPVASTKSPKRKWLVVAAVVLVVVIITGVVVAATTGHSAAPKAAPKTTGGTASLPAANAKTPTTIRLIATGDFIAHDSVNAAAKQADGSYNYLPMMSDFVPIFAKADVRFCNDPILNGGSQFGVTGYPKFNSPADFVTDMGKLGCNVVNTASNHSFDKTQDSITASVDAWSKVPNTLAVAGENRSQAEHDTVHYFTVKGVKFAFLAYTTYINSDAPAQNAYGVNVFSQAFASQQIAAAKANGAQIIIASMRWGTEYSTIVNAEQKADAQYLANQGVNLILGHGSHELQTVDQLTGSGGNKTIVWYSLGNFINTQEPAETLFNGLAVIDFDIASKQITTQSYLPLYMHYEWTAAQAAADNTNARNKLHMYLLEDTTQPMIDAQQLKTTVAAQTQRLTDTLNATIKIPLITSKQYQAQ